MSPYASLVRTAAGAAVAAVLLGGLPAHADPTTVAATPGYDAAATTQLYAQVNDHRRLLGLGALAVDTRLADVAKAYTLTMAASGTLAHNDALFTSASHDALDIAFLGENVGDTWAVDRIQPMFLNSPHHRENIESPRYGLAGFAVVLDGSGQYWVTEDFGSARTAAQVAAPVVHHAVAPAPVRARIVVPAAVVRARPRTVAPRIPVVVPPRAERTPRLDAEALAAVTTPVPTPGRTPWVAAAFVAAALAASGLLRLRRRARLDG